MKKDDHVLKDWKESEKNIDQRTARKFVWRTRLAIGFTVIRILLGVFLIYVLYQIPVEIYFEHSGKRAEFDRFVATVVETRHAGIEVDKLSHPRAEISPLLTQETTLPVYRQVGGWEVVVGEVKAKKRLLGKLSYTIEYNKKYIHEQMEYPYALPPDLPELTDSYQPGELVEPAEAQLEKIPDGFVVQLQFSLKKGMKPEELFQILNKYDVTVLQMPVYAGEIKEFETDRTTIIEDGVYTYEVPTLMLRPFVEYDEKNRLSIADHIITAEYLEESVETFYRDLSWLIEKGGYSEQELDEKRLAYLRKHGIKVFGATVTGPVREAEKLIQEEQFHKFHVTGIEVWNWYGP